MTGRDLARPPATLLALVAEPEAVQALDLELALRGMGYAVLGPVGAGGEALALLRLRLPDVALLGARLRDDALPRVAEALAAAAVPFAVMATGNEDAPLAGHPLLRAAPRLAKPYQDPELRRAVGGLRRARLAEADRHVAQGRERLFRQRLRLGRLAAAGGDTVLAEKLAHEFARTLELMRAHQEQLRDLLAAAG